MYRRIYVFYSKAFLDAFPLKRRQILAEISSILGINVLINREYWQHQNKKHANTITRKVKIHSEPNQIIVQEVHNIFHKKILDYPQVAHKHLTLDVYSSGTVLTFCQGDGVRSVQQVRKSTDAVVS